VTLSPFTVAVPDETLSDLRQRLTRSRFAEPSAVEPWAAGVDPSYLRELVAYWIDGFDWRAREAELNRHPQFVADVAGCRVHFVRALGARTDDAPPPLPLILTHGWPSAFVEMLPLVPLLTDPARFGGEAADAFDVIVPSLPGFGFSGLPPDPLTRARIAALWTELMTGVLGYSRFGAFGGDIGAGVTAWLGAAHADRVAGIHVIHPPVPTDLDGLALSTEEQAFIDAEAIYDETDGGYSAMQVTRPDTIAAALIDSPAGLAAWLVDKFRDWSDGGGELERSIDRDTLLTIVTLYWVTGTIGSSFRTYYDYRHNEPRPRITAPTAVTLSSEPLMRGFPRSLAERACAAIHHWSEPGRGGHFLPMEEPELLAEELRTSFRPLRAGD
jgi:pimeloyl-ACP methyl ester carboxylesterase